MILVRGLALASLIAPAGMTDAAATTPATRLQTPPQAETKAVDPELDARVREIASDLRCPTCRSLSVYDSPSQMAQQMRTLIREQLRAGMSSEEIDAYFVDRYGEWILLRPTRTGLNWAVWLMPIFLVFGGLTFVLLIARRWVERGREREAALLENTDGEG